MVNPISNRSGQLPVEPVPDTEEAQAITPSTSPVTPLEPKAGSAGMPKRPRSPSTDGNRSPKRTRNAVGAPRPQQTLAGMALSTIAQWVKDAPPDTHGHYEAAAERIRECWTDTGKTSLYIGGLQIATLPPLPPHLESLLLQGCNFLVSPPELRHCSQLRKLELHTCPGLKEVPDLTQCTQLDELKICGSYDLIVPPDLTQCIELKILDLYKCKGLESAPDLTQCTKLEDLSLEDCKRVPAAPDLTQCIELKILNLHGCEGLGSTPDLTHCTKLEALFLNGCERVPAAPDLTQCIKLMTLDLNGCEGLESAPDLTQCTKLEDLSLEGCRRVPAAPDLTQCIELVMLNLSECEGLESPPDLTQCTRLQKLSMLECDALLAPPDLRRCTKLKELYMFGCSSLVEPPDVRQCPDLTKLRMSDCPRLVTPPLLSTHLDLRNVDLADTPLTSLPANLLQLPPACYVQLSLGSLSEAVRRDFMAAVAAIPQDQRPSIDFDMVNASPDLPVEPLHVEAESWLPGSGTAWQAFAQEPSARDFCAFLGRIRQTAEFRNERLCDNVEGRVQALLLQLGKPDSLALRQLCFAQAGEAVTTCDDRIALTLLHLETACSAARISAEVARGEHDQNPLALLKQGTGMYHLQQLEDHAREKVATLRFVDEIEVHLGYLVALSGEFALPVQMQTMLYPACSNVHEPEIAAARTQLQRCALKTSPDPELVRFLSGWEPLVMQLQRPAMAHLSEGHAQSMEQEVVAEKSNLQQTLSELDSRAEDYALQARSLQAQYNRIEATVATRRHNAAIVRLISEALNA